jgi:hypothetical protein
MVAGLISKLKRTLMPGWDKNRDGKLTRQPITDS